MVRQTEQTLLEQMKLSDLEIQRRMEFLGLDRESLKLLELQQPMIQEQIDEIVESFYEKQTAIDEIALLIGDAETLQRLHTAQRAYILDLFAGFYDAQYVNNRLRIGMVHKRIGVEPKLYLSAVVTLKEVIYNTLKEAIVDETLLNDTFRVLDRLLHFDVTLVFDTYIDSLLKEVETAKRRTEEYAKSLEEKVAQRTEELEKMAKIDPLTNVYNQRALREMLRYELARAKRKKEPLSLIYFDVDKFKQINDEHGHIKGDEVLRSIGMILNQNVREMDIACRYGGDEFCVVLPETTAKSAQLVAQKIINAFENLYGDFSVSIGISQTGVESYCESDILIGNADKAMYTSKTISGSAITK